MQDTSKSSRHSSQHFRRFSPSPALSETGFLISLKIGLVCGRQWQCTALWMDSQVFYEWRRPRDPSTSPNWYFPHNCVNILRTGVVVCVCVYVPKFNLKLQILLTSWTQKSTQGKQASSGFLRKSFQVVQGDGCLIIFFLWMKCAMQMRAIHKKREHGGHFCF